MDIDDLIKETYRKMRWFEESIKEAKRRGEYYSELDKDKMKIKVLDMFLAELHRLSTKGQRTISKKKAEKLLDDIVYKKLHLSKSPFESHKL
jgi:hypothetical protein